jgi:DNA repair protein RadC
MKKNTANTKPADTSAGHRRRLRDKFLAAGLSGFHDYEVIELLLTLATPRKDCKAAAKSALKQFKTFQGVIEASPAELATIKGIGPQNVFGLKFVKSASDRYLKKKLIDENPLSNSEDLFNYLFHRIRDRRRECFLALFLTAKNRVIEVETLFEGTLTASAVYPREVVAAALDHRAAAIIFAHNHPSGDPQPSGDDISLTQKLYFACALMNITVHEHLIIGDNSYFSFADKGYIGKFAHAYVNIDRHLEESLRQLDDR